MQNPESPLWALILFHMFRGPTEHVFLKSNNFFLLLIFSLCYSNF